MQFMHHGIHAFVAISSIDHAIKVPSPSIGHDDYDVNQNRFFGGVAHWIGFEVGLGI